MNSDEYNYLLNEAQKTFPYHKRLKIRLRNNPTNPFGSTYMAKFIENKAYPEYELYIHDNYFTFSSLNLKNFEPFRVSIDDKLWIELYCAFKLVKIIN